ncbi:unnamed protein product, partial [Rotaria magnacalcarata]
MASKECSKINKKETYLNIEIKDFIEFDNQIDTNDLLPKWA